MFMAAEGTTALHPHTKKFNRVVVKASAWLLVRNSTFHLQEEESSGLLSDFVCFHSFQTSGDVQQDVAAPSSAAEARPTSQNHLVTVGERAASRSSAAQDQPAPRPVEEAAGQHQHPLSGDQ